MTKAGWIVALLLGSLSNPAHSQEFRIGIGEEFEKVIKVEGGQLQGSLSRNYRCMLDESGYRYEFVVLPLARLVHELRLGRVDVGLPLVQETERDLFATFGDTVIESSYLRVSLPDNTLKHDDPKARYTYIRGFAGQAILRELEGRTLAVSKWEQAIEILRRDRADFLLITEKTYRAISKNMTYVLSAQKISDLDVAFYVSSKHPELLHALNQANGHCRNRVSVNK